jgi:hypothetical protein
VSASIAEACRPLMAAMRIVTMGVDCATVNPLARTVESTPATWSSCTSKKSTLARGAPPPTSSSRSRLDCTR